MKSRNPLFRRFSHLDELQIVDMALSELEMHIQKRCREPVAVIRRVGSAMQMKLKQTRTASDRCNDILRRALSSSGGYTSLTEMVLDLRRVRVEVEADYARRLSAQAAARRERPQKTPFYEKARLLMLAGRVGEFSLWISSSQVTDMIFILTDGGKKSKVPEVLENLRIMRTFVNVYAVTDADIDKMLATTWADPEDALLVELALKMRADAIITRDEDFPQTDMIRVQDCSEFFDWLREEKGISYAEIDM